APGRLWESEIKVAVEQSVFFIPIVTPTSIRSSFCQVEFDAFLERERALARSDLVFPILYIRIPGLDDPARVQSDPLLSAIAKRQYVDWRELRHLDVNSTEMKRTVERFCKNIVEALHRPWLSPQDREREEQVAAERRAEEERQRQEVDAKRRADEE